MQDKISTSSIGHWVCIFLKGFFFFLMFPILTKDNENLTLFPAVPNQMHKVSKDQKLIKTDGTVASNRQKFQNRSYVIELGRALKSKAG